MTMLSTMHRLKIPGCFKGSLVGLHGLRPGPLKLKPRTSGLLVQCEISSKCYFAVFSLQALAVRTLAEMSSVIYPKALLDLKNIKSGNIRKLEIRKYLYNYHQNHIHCALNLMPGLHLQRNRRKSAIQKVLTTGALLVEPDFYDGCVAQL